MKEEIYPLNTHMHGWYISKRICTDLIKYFHTCEHHHREGQVSGGEVKKDTKDLKSFSDKSSKTKSLRKKQVIDVEKNKKNTDDEPKAHVQDED